MRICLDTSDLVRLEKADASHFDRLERWVNARGAQLVLSHTLIKEFAVSMNRQREIVLNRLERLPLIWFRTTAVERLELRTAIHCFTVGRPWEPVIPFMGNLVDAVLDSGQSWDPGDPGAIWRARQMSLAKFAVAVQGYVNPWAASVSEWLHMNREAGAANPRRDFGGKVRWVGASLPECSMIDPEILVQHLWASAEWCPGMKLAFHVTQRLRGDRATQGGSSDMDDLVRMSAVPYVDVFVTDKSKREYLRQLSRSEHVGSCSYWGRCRIVGSLDEVVGSDT